MIDPCSDEILKEHFPLYQHRLSYLCAGLRRQKHWLMRVSTRVQRAHTISQVIIVILGTIASLLIALSQVDGWDKLKLVALLFTTLGTVAGSIAALFDFPAHYISRSRGALLVAELEGEMVYTLIRQLDALSQVRETVDTKSLVDEAIIDEWHARLAKILRETWENHLATFRGKSDGPSQ